MIAAPARPHLAIERAVLLYAQHGLVLARDLEQYLRHPQALCIKRPDLLLLARPVRLAEWTRWLDEPEAADAWYIYLLVGTPAAALAEMPHVLPWCCWHRNFRTAGGRLHVAPTTTIIKKLRPYYGR